MQTFFAERFFTLFDDNGDGKIDMKELIAGLELLTNGTETDKLTFLFRAYDIDGKSTITPSQYFPFVVQIRIQNKTWLS